MPRGKRKQMPSLSARINQMSKDLAALSVEVQRAEGLQKAVEQYVNGRSATPRRRGRPPGTKNRATRNTRGAKTPARRRRRARKSPSAVS